MDGGGHSSSSSSDQTTATSGPGHGFVCTVCFKVFRSGQALGGHQNAHLYERSIRQSTPNILGAVLNHPLPQEADGDVQILAAAGSLSSNSTRRLPPMIALNRKQGDNGSKTRRATGGDFPPLLEPRAKYHPYDSNQRQVGEESRRRRLTKNFLGEMKPKEVGKEREGLERSSGVDLELSLKRTEYIDLELKLGF